MKCKKCHVESVKAGLGRKGVQRYKCPLCGKRFSNSVARPFGVDIRTPREKVIMVLRCLTEGNSVRSTARLCDVEPRTVLNILIQAGARCERIMGQVRNVRVSEVQCDEIWGFVKKKETHKTEAEAKDNSIGDAYTFVGIERHSRLVLNFALGRRDNLTTEAFIEGLRRAINPLCCFQVSTDGFVPYIAAIDDAFGERVSFAQVVKEYKKPHDGHQRYSPAPVVSITHKVLIGSPKAESICTSHVERSNLTMRMQIRRLTRLTNAFSKKWDNLWAAVCLYFAWYNFVRIHRSLRVTPAMAAGITERVWDMEDLIFA